MKYLLFAVVMLSLYGCKSSTKKTTVAPLGPVPIESLNGADPLTSEGENQGAKISEDGQRILFASRKRSQHRHYQIYELNLQTLKSRRITFNDGDTLGSGWVPGTSELYYTSTTDELKENPTFVQKKLGETPEVSKFGLHDSFQPMEIYRSTNEGEHISRLTEHAGFDGYSNWVKENEFFFISQEKQQFLIQKFSKDKSQVLFKATQPIFDLAFSSKENAWAWIQADQSKKVNELVVARKNLSSSTVVPLAQGYYKEPVWINGMNQILVSAKLKNDKDFNIYHYDFGANCLREVVANKGDDLQVHIDSRNSFIVFTNNGEQGRHIYKKTFNWPNGACL